MGQCRVSLTLLGVAQGWVCSQRGSQSRGWEWRGSQVLNWPKLSPSVLLSQDDYQRQGSGYRNVSPARACCFLWVSVFMLAVTLPGWDCVRMHACNCCVWDWISLADEVFFILYFFCSWFNFGCRCVKRKEAPRRRCWLGVFSWPPWPPEVRTPGH